MNTTIVASATTTLGRERERDEARSRSSERLFDVSRDNSPVLGAPQVDRGSCGGGLHHTRGLGGGSATTLHPMAAYTGLSTATVIPAPSPISSHGCLKICVSGRVFELSLDLVRGRYPNSILAHPEIMDEYFQPSLGMFFFDRNRMVFEYIMQFFQGDGIMEFPDEVPTQLLEIELDFYRIGYREVNRACDKPIEYVTSIWDKGRLFFNEPGSSILAKLWMIFDIVFIISSVLVFVLRTEQVIIDLEVEYPQLKLFFWMVNISCAIFFTFDILGRWTFSRDKLRFFMDIMPWLDIVAIIPLYTEIFEDYINVNGNMLNVLKIFRMARVARCLKLIRRSKRLLLIFRILVECKEELSILLMVWITGTMISGSIIYFVEEPENHVRFYSIMESCWWAITTIGTIGYGNIHPVTVLGQLITTVLIFCSMIFMTVPMTIIIRRFSDSYERVERNKARVKMFGAVNCTAAAAPAFPPPTTCSTASYTTGPVEQAAPSGLSPGPKRPTRREKRDQWVVGAGESQARHGVGLSPPGLLSRDEGGRDRET